MFCSRPPTIQQDARERRRRERENFGIFAEMQVKKALIPEICQNDALTSMCFLLALPPLTMQKPGVRERRRREFGASEKNLGIFAEKQVKKALIPENLAK